MAEVWDQVLISLRLDSGPRDGDTSWGSGKKIDPLTNINTKYLVVSFICRIFASELETKTKELCQ